MLIDGLVLSGLLVDYCDGFISCLDSHNESTVHFVGVYKKSHNLAVRSQNYPAIWEMN